MRIDTTVLIAAAMVASVPASAQDLSLPPETFGSYAPAGDCARQPRLTVDKAGIHIDTPAGRRGPLSAMISYTFIGGARYDGIQVWALIRHGGKDRYGDDRTPLTLTFNAGEKPGVITVERSDPQVALDGPLSSLAGAPMLMRCRPGAPATAAAAAAPVPSAGSASAAVAARQTGAPPAGGAAATPAQSPAAGFAAIIAALMPPASSPAGSFYDWRFIERAPHVSWAPLPPEMLDRPLADGHMTRRNGTATLGGRPLKVMAAGARTMVMAHYVKNEGQPIGEQAVLAALRAGGLTATPVRCGISKALAAPTWYRLTGAGRRPALLWIAQPRGPSSPWEGFSLNLDSALKPLSPREATVFTDRCA